MSPTRGIEWTRRVASARHARSISGVGTCAWRRNAVSRSIPWTIACRLRSRPPNGAKAMRYSALTGSTGASTRTMCRNPVTSPTIALPIVGGVMGPAFIKNLRVGPRALIVRDGSLAVSIDSDGHGWPSPHHDPMAATQVPRPRMLGHWPTSGGSTTIAAPCSPVPRRLESVRSSRGTCRGLFRRTAWSIWQRPPTSRPPISPTSRPSSGTSERAGRARPSSAASVVRATTQRRGCSSRPGGFRRPRKPAEFHDGHSR